MKIHTLVGEHVHASQPDGSTLNKNQENSLSIVETPSVILFFLGKSTDTGEILVVD